MQTLRSRRLMAANCALAISFLALPSTAQNPSGSAPQAPRELTAYLPANTPLVLDLYDGAACAKALLDLIQPLPKGLPKEVHAAFAGLPAFIKGKTGMSLEDLLTVLAPSQVTAAYFPDGAGGRKPFPVVMSRVTEEGEIARLLRRLKIELPLHIKNGILTLSDNRRHLLKALRFRESGKPSLLQNRDYIAGRTKLEPGKSVRLFVDMKFLRETHKKGFLQRTPSGAQLLVGPIASALDIAGRLDARLDILADRLVVTGRLDASTTAGKNKAMGRLVKHGSSERQLPPAPAGTIATFSLDRDLRAFFKNASKILDEDAATGLETFLSQANQFLVGTTLVDGLLPELDMPGAFFVTDTAPEDPEAQPRLKLPAFMLAVPLTGRKPRVVRQSLGRALKVIGLVVTAQRTRNKTHPPRLAARNERRGEYRFEFLGYDDWEGPGDPPTEMGLGVTLLLAHDHVIIASTRDGAIRMATAIKNKQGKKVRGDYLLVSGAQAARYFAKNHDLLALDRVLEEGESMADARRFWRAATAVIAQLDLELRLAPGQRDTRLVGELRRVRK